MTPISISWNFKDVVLSEEGFCNNCNSSLVIGKYLDNFRDKLWDCSNKLCKNHLGENVLNGSTPYFFKSKETK